MGWQDAPIANKWEQAPVANNIDIQIDPQTNAPYDPSIPTNMTLEKGRNALPYKPTKMEQLGNMWDASKLEGLAPEILPIGGISHLPLTQRTMLGAEGLINAAKQSTPAQKMGNILSQSGNFIGSIPNKILSFQSGKSPEAFNTIYQAYKQNIPEIKQAISEATPLGQKLYNDMVYNYTRKLQVPHDVAIMAEDYTKGHPEGLGAWDLLKQHYKDLPEDIPAAIKRTLMPEYKAFNELSDAEKLKQATQAGIDTSVWNPIAARTGKDDLANIAWSLGKKAILPSMLHPLAALSSPRIARMAAILAGKGANVAGKVSNAATDLVNMLPEASLDNIINTAILTNKANKEQQ
jgi:hypothetical protein